MQQQLCIQLPQWLFLFLCLCNKLYAACRMLHGAANTKTIAKANKFADRWSKSCSCRCSKHNSMTAHMRQMKSNNMRQQHTVVFMALPQLCDNCVHWRLQHVATIVYTSLVIHIYKCQAIKYVTIYCHYAKCVCVWVRGGGALAAAIELFVYLMCGAWRHECSAVVIYQRKYGHFLLLLCWYVTQAATRNVRINTIGITLAFTNVC